MIDEVIKLAEVIDYFTPKEFKNIKVNFKVQEINLQFICDDKDIGYFRVFIYDNTKDLLAYVEGKNQIGSKTQIGQNIKKYSNEFLYNCFHMCRCYREFERTSDINYSKGFDYFREKVIDIYQENNNQKLLCPSEVFLEIKAELAP